MAGTLRWGLAIVGLAMSAGGLLLPGIGAQALAAETQIVNSAGQPAGGPYARWVRQAHVPAPPGKVAVRISDCPGYPRLAACVLTRRPRSIFIRPALRHNRLLFLHELGHVFDLTVLSASDRRAFRGIHRMGTQRWFGAGNRPAEWFADGYRLCALRTSLTTRPRPTGYGYAPTPARHRATCRLIAASAKRRAPRRPPQTPPTVGEPPAAVPPPAPAPAPPRRCWLLWSCPR